MTEARFFRSFTRKFAFSIFAMIAAVSINAARAEDSSPPIIDMHLHSYSEDGFHTAPDLNGDMSSADYETHFQETYERMRRHNIVLGVVSGTRADEEAWMAKDTDGRLMRGMQLIKLSEWTPESFETAVKSGEIKVFGEIAPYYFGRTIADPIYAPYLEICEKYDIPLALHTGGGPSRVTYRGAPNARLTLASPFLAEDILVKYPKLRVYLMHSGVHKYEDALRLMIMYPRVYSDLGVVLWVHEMPKYYGEEFLKLAKKFDLLKRVMFGSDQMVWPQAITMSIDQLNSFDFLTAEEKRDIFYNNAARFLRLSDEEIAAHHGKKP